LITWKRGSKNPNSELLLCERCIPALLTSGAARYGGGEPTFIVCANFCDSKSRVVTEKEGRQWYAA